MSNSESTLLQLPGTERTTHNTIETNNDNVEIYTARNKKYHLASIEEKLRVKSPQIIKRKLKIEEVKQTKKNFNVIKLNNLAEKVYRKDANGVEINSMNKRKVKVTFIDKISSNELVQIKDIESLKIYNVGAFGQPEKGVGKTKHQCTCILI